MVQLETTPDDYGVNRVGGYQMIFPLYSLQFSQCLLLAAGYR